MSISEEIRRVVEAQLKADEFVVDIVLKGSQGTQKLLVFVDSDTGMTIDDCAKISKYLSGYLEEKDPFDSGYTLEVSTPGLDHPLKLKRQYMKNIGRGLRIKTFDNKQLEGELRSVNDDKIILESTSSNDQRQQQMEVLFDDIKKAMVLVSFRKKG